MNTIDVETQDVETQDVETQDVETQDVETQDVETQHLASLRLASLQCARCSALKGNRLHILCTSCEATHKYCPGCKKALEREHFFNAKNRKDGKTGRCKACWHTRSYAELSEEGRKRQRERMRKHYAQQRSEQGKTVHTRADRQTLGIRIVKLRAMGHNWQEVAASVGLSETVARARYHRWCRAQEEKQ